MVSKLLLDYNMIVQNNQFKTEKIQKSKYFRSDLKMQWIFCQVLNIKKSIINL